MKVTPKSVEVFEDQLIQKFVDENGKEITLVSSFTPPPDVGAEFEALERTTVAAWIAEAAHRLHDAAEYMAANEQRFSEDIFDDLRAISEKLADYAHEVAHR